MLIELVVVVGKWGENDRMIFHENQKSRAKNCHWTRHIVYFQKTMDLVYSELDESAARVTQPKLQVLRKFSNHVIL